MADIQKSAVLGIDGACLTVDHTKELNDLFKNPVHCRYCGAEVHADSYQVVMYNGGVLCVAEWGSDEEQKPLVWCGCGDACMTRDIAKGHAHLVSLGIIDE